MEHSLVSEQDGSIALLIKGDLQFDSKDEYIYHEGLVLPGLAVAASRIKTPLKTLVIGGGDGLVARELFKSPRVESLALVDYSQEIVTLAREKFADINNASMTDSRITSHVMDAWNFVEEALNRNETYDLIVSDLTVADDIAGARFHSVEWYSRLARLLSAAGVLSVNAVSPHATPEAFWSIFNSISAGGLKPRPYHVVIPSFVQAGFGDDWGFLLASAEAVKKEELKLNQTGVSHTKFLTEDDCMQSLFLFPEKLFDVQSTARPALDGSDILLHYFRHPSRIDFKTATLRDAFTFGNEELSIPEPDTGRHILPPDLGSALAETFSTIDDAQISRPGEIQAMLQQAFVHIPALQQVETSELISDFLLEPITFLRAIDLPALFSRLLGRASELPSQVVSELRRLQEGLQEWSSDEEAILSMGKRVTMTLIVAIVIGNLLYPDMAYGKGVVGRGGWGNNYYGGTTYTNYRRRNYINKGPIGPGPNAETERQMLRNSLPQRNDVSDAEYIDEHGVAYPARRYCIFENNSKQMISATYRLDLAADILSDGRIVMPVTERAYLLIGAGETSVIDQRDGRCTMKLQNDPSIIQVTRDQILRQLQLISSQKAAGVDSQVGSAPVLDRAYHALAKASDQIQSADASTTSQALVIENGSEILPGVWLMPDGKFVAVKREDGGLVYLDGNKWYSDPGKTELQDPYPESFRMVVWSQLTKMVRDFSSTNRMLVSERDGLSEQHKLFARELAAYKIEAGPLVDFGSRQVAKEDALRLMQRRLQNAQLQIEELNARIAAMPPEVKLASIALERLASSRRA